MAVPGRCRETPKAARLRVRARAGRGRACSNEGRCLCLEESLEEAGLVSVKRRLSLRLLLSGHVQGPHVERPGLALPGDRPGTPRPKRILFYPED